MKPAEPGTSDDVFTTPPEHVYPHLPRTYFLESPSPARRRPYSAEAPTVYGNQHLSPPLPRGSPLNPQRSLGQDRRRPDPADGPSPSSDSKLRTRRSPLLIGTDDHLPQNLRSVPGIDNEIGEASVFSDEYNLYPRILQDVQRALRLKAKREAKMRTSQQLGSEIHTSPSPNASSSSRAAKSPTKHTYTLLSSPTPSSPFATPLRKNSTGTSSDIDFSPSTRRIVQHEAQHPVPCSLDNGLTLDWGGSVYDEEKSEKKWAISVRKRDKARLPPLEMMQDQQEKTHRERLSKLRASASSQTIRKAAMTSDQLQRRYKLMQEYLDGSPKPLNLAMVAQWHGSQDETTRQELENTEPLTWLKHLSRRERLLPRRYLSARIVEEFIRAQTSQQNVEPNLEDYSSRISVFRPVSDEQFVSNGGRVSQDGKLRSPRGSFDVESRRSGESGLSSPIGGTSNPFLSPFSSARPQGQMGIASRTPSRERTGSGAEDVAKLDTTFDTGPKKIINSNHHMTTDLGNERNKAIIIGPDMGESVPKLILPLSEALRGDDQVPEQKYWSSSKSQTNLVPGANRRFASPSLSRLPPPPGEEAQNEEALHQEYEAKTALLEDSLIHNQRIRQLLNRISISVKDYDTVQRTAMSMLGKKYQALPKELIESFGHDPAAVTGSTRRLKGWRAIEDIHQRLVRQREVFAAFLASEPHRARDYGSILDDQVTSLIRNLSILEEQKDELAQKAREVESVLRDVQKVQKGVKDDYNKTVSLTSALYPELSQAVALEEGYRDHYQQIWEWGMDALTFLLDTVTPFWRTYGKSIGEDIRDFLVIPLYRNEFTGETKRYRIKAFPRRSLRHWVFLVTFFLASILVNILQVRAALSSSMHFKLRLIPYDGIRYTALPFFWIGILIQWWAVLVEFGIVFMELGVVAWWLGWSVNLLT